MEEWKKYKLGEITSKIGSGATPKGGRDSYLGGNIALIRSQNVLDFSFSKLGLAYINEVQAEKLSNVEVYEKDVLLNITGDSVARVCIVPNNVLPARVNQHVAIIRGNDKVDYRYLLYYLQYIKPQLLSLSQGGATRNALTKKMIEELEVKMPSKGIQKEIVSILYALDSKIELNRRINDNLEQQTQALFKSWFVDFEPFRGGKFVDSELGMIPEGWNIQPISSIFNFQEGPGIRNWQYVNNGTKFINIRCINNDIINIQNANMISDEEAQGKYAHFMLKENDIVISCSGTLGRKALVLKEYLPLCLNTSVIRFTPRINRQLGFLYGYLGSSLFLNKQIELASGSVQANFGPIHLKGMSIAIPDNNVLNQFSDIVNSIIQKKKNIISESLRLTNLRDSILPKLMSGKIKIDKLNS
ncbi:restriction endonuclease subunit S [Bacteroides ovatus]|jgi:type I restriction enzyme S subunit|uniref:restriction endonuclease subunit S n=1 Tax=Bacteroides TaxID=816 RepID=UPI0012314EA6|nr:MULTISPECIES: restriction endonuclease subunit S [Bacteroides]KAA3899716.1 restriction endonuclease subunit S [Bacteroides ovatus]KAA3911921.1 restriction endonuclease subunit S [Bacteroides ovatus]MCE8987868.1 restriction endonuclease subunit S [Bacteroides ovatus]MDB0714886.1 restriction endonuclease subunit S [Bacteroides xylanisolvens]MDB0739557.1 restriction endonuclease subunit S [Bacteroides xylanisolvens]